MIRQLRSAVVVGAVLVATAPGLAAQQPALDPQGSVAVVVAYADGRRVPMTVGPTSGGAWTSTFPRVAGWAPPANEVPVGAIDYVCARTGDGVRVAIGVFRGSQRLERRSHHDGPRDSGSVP